MQFGFKLMAEAFGPQEMVRQAIETEQAGVLPPDLLATSTSPWPSNS